MMPDGESKQGEVFRQVENRLFCLVSPQNLPIFLFFFTQNAEKRGE